MKVEGVKRTDLIGLNGSIFRTIQVIDAYEYPNGTSVRVLNGTGEEYWTTLDELDLDS